MSPYPTLFSLGKGDLTEGLRFATVVDSRLRGNDGVEVDSFGTRLKKTYLQCALSMFTEQRTRRRDCRPSSTRPTSSFRASPLSSHHPSTRRLLSVDPTVGRLGGRFIFQSSGVDRRAEVALADGAGNVDMTSISAGGAIFRRRGAKIK